MLTADLRNILYQEHAHERKISIRNFILVAGILLIVVCLLFLFFSNQLWQMLESVFNEGIPTYIKVILPIAFLSILIYPIMVLMESLKRDEKIEEVISLLGQKKVADNFRTEKIYKTTIPLLKINFKLNAFHYLHFYLNRKAYKLPVPLQLIPDITAMLSGANMQKVNSIWNELHAGEQVETTEVVVPLKTKEEFKVFAAEALNDRAENMEKNRKKLLKRIVLLTVGVFILIGSFIFYNYQKANKVVEAVGEDTEKLNESIQGQGSTVYILLIAFGIIYVVGYVYYRYRKKKSANVEITNDGSDYTTFKEFIFQKMVHFINPGFEYVKASYIGRDEIADSGIFVNKNYDIGGNDLIAGRHQGVPFQYSDITIAYKANFSKEKEEPDSVFSGQYFIAKFNKQFAASLYVYAKPSFTGGFTNNQIHSYLEKSLPKVTLEDPEFNKLYDVCCDDQVAARYILSTSLMQSIKDLSVQDKKTQLFIAFRNNKVSVLNNTKRDKFEVTLYTKIKPELLEEFYADLYKQLRIIEEMKLNVQIWKQ